MTDHYSLRVENFIMVERKSIMWWSIRKSFEDDGYEDALV